MAETKKLGFPRYANYNCAVKYFVDHAFSDAEYVLPPKLTRRSDELGSKYSPEAVCFPFKTLLGSMIEVLEAGANTLVMPYGYCRLGYFGELMEEILRSLGYEFDFINMTEYNTGKKKDWIRLLKRMEPHPNLPKITKCFMDADKMVGYLDDVTERYYEDVGFDPSGKMKKMFKRFIADLYHADSRRDIEEAYRRVIENFDSVDLKKPDRPLRVGIVGEFYTVMDSFSNLDLEQKIADMGVEVHRWMNITNRLLHYPGEKNLHVAISDYCDYEMGPTSTANIWAAKQYADAGFDGIIHVKSAYCTPEIDIVPVLQNLCRDKKLPLLCLSFGSQTSDVGVETRLEAFYDMVRAKQMRI
jgi:predicted nucleotide-binding protein (sugar kinase/HSP70/actin superfamily)